MASPIGRLFLQQATNVVANWLTDRRMWQELHRFNLIKQLSKSCIFYKYYEPA